MLSAAKHPFYRKDADAKGILRCAQNDKVLAQCGVRA